MGNAGLPQRNCHMGLPVCIQLVVPKPAGEIHFEASISWILAYAKILKTTCAVAWMRSALLTITGMKAVDTE